jgi:large subunit ribosomal protein L19
LPPEISGSKFTVMDAIKFVHEQLSGKREFPKFKPGDNITVNYKIIEGNKERIQSFKGDVIKRQGTGHTASFTVRKISDSIGVERVFPYYSPNIESIVVNKTGAVRQAKLFYQRKRSGKSARIREKRLAVSTTVG